MSRDGKRMVMWLSDSNNRPACTPDSFARAVRSIPTRPRMHRPHHLEITRPTQNQEYDR